MQFLLVFQQGGEEFEFGSTRRIFESTPGFRGVRFDEPGGAALEATYAHGDESVIVQLSRTLKSITFSRESTVALNAALLLQTQSEKPLRITDSDYSFDLGLSDFQTMQQLEAAIDNARAE